MSNENVPTDGGGAAGGGGAAAAGSDKITLIVPDVVDAQPISIGFIYAATRSKAFFEGTAEGGPGTPLFSAYVFPYTPPEAPPPAAGTAAAPEGEPPLFVAYLFPFVKPGEANLGGGKGGGVSALGGGATGQHLFNGRFFSFEKIADGGDEEDV